MAKPSQLRASLTPALELLRGEGAGARGGGVNWLINESDELHLCFPESSSRYKFKAPDPAEDDLEEESLALSRSPVFNWALVTWSQTPTPHPSKEDGWCER